MFVFYDYSDATNTDNDIVGDEYKQLIDICFKYCKTVAFKIAPKQDISICKEMQKFIVAKNERITYNFYQTTYIDVENGEGTESQTVFYELTPELCNVMKNSVNSIFEWIYGRGFKNPEDPVFFREDGSVFFSSVIHDGELFIYPREDEDVQSFLEKNNWIRME